MNIAATNRQIVTKVYLSHYLGEGKDELVFGFRSGRIRSLISIATGSSHMNKVEKTVLPLISGVFFILSSNTDMHDSI